MAPTMSVLAVVLLSCGVAAAQFTVSNFTPVTGPVNPFPNSSERQLLTDPALTKKVNGSQPEQIHLAQAMSPDEMWVMWSSGDSFIGARDTAALGQAQLDAQPTPKVYYSTRSGGPYKVKKGKKSIHSTIYYFDNATFPLASNYTSPVQHLVKLGYLYPETTYYYMVGDGTKENMSPELSFTTLPEVGKVKPIRIGMFGDLGDTSNSSSTLEHLAANKPQIILNMGDLSYADRHAPALNPTDDALSGTQGKANIFNGKSTLTDGRRWDGWLRLCEFIYSRVPHHAANGNHEIEADSQLTRFAAYKTRFPAPGTYAQPLANGKVTKNTELWYSIEFAGVHVTFITPYEDHTPGSPQYKWLVNDLKHVDRTATPWIIVVEHHPWYTTRAGGDYRGNECMRQYFEPIFYKYGVDLMVNGHVHTYERSFPVTGYKLDACGTTHILIGDGGNAGSVSDGYVDGAHGGKCPGAVAKAPGVDPGSNDTLGGGDFTRYNFLGYCNATVTNPGLPWCFTTQPEFSAYREPSYGHAILDVKNATYATWSWYRNQDGFAVVTDSVVLSADTKLCPNKAAQGPRVPKKKKNKYYNEHEHEHYEGKHRKYGYHG